jgi:hypothetical protein
VASSIALGVGFIISTILLVTSTTLKLQYAAIHTGKPEGDQLDISNYAHHDALTLDRAFAGLLQLMVLFADGLMVSPRLRVQAQLMLLTIIKPGVSMLSCT